MHYFEEFDSTRKLHNVVVTVHEYEDDEDDETLKHDVVFHFTEWCEDQLKIVFDIVSEVCKGMHWSYTATYFDPKDAPDWDGAFAKWTMCNYFGLDDIEW